MCKKTAAVALILVIIGALNWGLIGVSGINAVELIVGADSGLADIIYIVVGLAGLYSLVLFKALGLCSICSPKEGSCCSTKSDEKCCSSDEGSEPIGCCGGKEHIEEEKQTGCCDGHTVEKEEAGQCCRHK